MADHRPDVFFRPVVFPQDFLGLFTMLVGKLLVIEVVDQADDPPFFFVFITLAGHIAHDPFDGQGMFDQAFGLVVFF